MTFFGGGCNAKGYLYFNLFYVCVCETEAVFNLVLIRNVYNFFFPIWKSLFVYIHSFYFIDVYNQV